MFRELKSFLKNIIIEKLFKIKSEKIKYEINRLGSEYGGWNIALTPSLFNSSAICCGAGEDISFDVELASKFKTKVLIVDPTPRSNVHVQEVLRQLDNHNTNQSSELNKIEGIVSYDLKSISKDQLIYLNKAIWIKEEKVKFYMPPNINHVSYSIVDYQNNFAQTGEYIYVDAVRYISLINSYNMKPEILKLDIEGAEYEVINDVLNYSLPNQVLLEYDELSDFSFPIIKRVKNTHKKLLNSGYILFKKEGSNFSYILKNLSKI